MLQYWTDLSSQFPWLTPVLELILLAAAAWAVMKFGIAWLRRWAGRSQSRLKEQFVKLANRALLPILALGVLAAALNLQVLSPRLLTFGNRVLYVSVLIVAIYYCTHAIRVLLEHWLSRKPSRNAIREPTIFLARVLFGAFGIMIVLDNLGISLTAVWTTLGIGSIAVALALQDTLSNFFAGVYVHLDGPVRVGDYVKLDNADEGFITQIGWRSTRIRTLPNNLIVVPNSKLASAVITNYSLPNSQMSLLVPISAPCSADPDFVERVLVDEAVRGAAEIPGLSADAKPFVRFIPGYGNSSLDFTLICQVNSYVDQYLVQHELRKRILRRFRSEGLDLPLPQSEVHLVVEDGHASRTSDHGQSGGNSSPAHSQLS